MRNYVILLSMSILLYACSKLEDPAVLNLDKIIKIKFEADSVLLADGIDKIIVTAELDAKNVAMNQNVIFTTEQGNFSNASSSNSKTTTVRADGYLAKAVLVSDVNPGAEIQLSAKVGEYTVYKTMKFAVSYPEKVYTSPSSFVFHTSAGSMLLNVNAIKTEGKVSNGAKIDFLISTVSGSPKLFSQPLFWDNSAIPNQSTISKISDDTGRVQLITRYFDGTLYKYGEDTLIIKVEN